MGIPREAAEGVVEGHRVVLGILYEHRVCEGVEDASVV